MTVPLLSQIRFPLARDVAYDFNPNQSWRQSVTQRHEMDTSSRRRLMLICRCVVMTVPGRFMPLTHINILPMMHGLFGDLDNKLDMLSIYLAKHVSICQLIKKTI